MPRGVYDRSKVKKENHAHGRDSGNVEVPVKVGVTADPLNLQVTIDPKTLEAACKVIQDRLNELAAHFQVPKDEVNPFEALFMIADLQKEMLTELKQIHTYLRMIVTSTQP